MVPIVCISNNVKINAELLNYKIFLNQLKSFLILLICFSLTGYGATLGPTVRIFLTREKGALYHRLSFMDNLGFRIKSKRCRRIFVVITIQKILFFLLPLHLPLIFFFFMQNLTGTQSRRKVLIKPQELCLFLPGIQMCYLLNAGRVPYCSLAGSCETCNISQPPLL